MVTNVASSRRSRHGFTILEAIIVLAVIGIVSVTSLIALRQVAPRAKLQSATTSADVLLKQMRLHAIRRQTDVEITLEDEGGSTKTVANMLAAADQPHFLVAHDVDSGDEITRLALPMSSSGDKGILLRANTFPGEKIVLTRLGQVEDVGSLIFGYPAGSGTVNKIEIRIENKLGKTSKNAYTELPPP